MNLSLEEISKAVGGNLSGSGSTKVRGYSIDSRTINAGDLFFAIKGPRFDGHEFLSAAAEKKAAAAVVDAAAVGALY
jgi:UDP-N-acetylmuramoyl-tripeptide--D-alanyl-D-alanine ligase